MKYFFVSLLIHLLLMGGLVYQQASFDHQAAPAVVVELYIPPQMTSNKMKKSGRYKKRKNGEITDYAKVKSTVKDAIDKSSSRIEDIINSTGNLEKVNAGKRGTETFLKSQEGKRMVASYVEQLKIYLEQNKVYPEIFQKVVDELSNGNLVIS